MTNILIFKENCKFQRTQARHYKLDQTDATYKQYITILQSFYRDKLEGEISRTKYGLNIVEALLVDACITNREQCAVLRCKQHLI